MGVGTNTSKKRILILSVVEILIILLLDVILITRLSDGQDAGGIRGMAIVIMAVTLVVVGIVAFLMI